MAELARHLDTVRVRGGDEGDADRPHRDLLRRKGSRASSHRRISELEKVQDSRVMHVRTLSVGVTKVLILEMDVSPNRLQNAL